MQSEEHAAVCTPEKIKHRQLRARNAHIRAVNLPSSRRRANEDAKKRLLDIKPECEKKRVCVCVCARVCVWRFSYSAVEDDPLLIETARDCKPGAAGRKCRLFCPADGMSPRMCARHANARYIVLTQGMSVSCFVEAWFLSAPLSQQEQEKGQGRGEAISSCSPSHHTCHGSSPQCKPESKAVAREPSTKEQNEASSPKYDNVTCPSSSIKHSWVRSKQTSTLLLRILQGNGKSGSVTLRPQATAFSHTPLLMLCFICEGERWDHIPNGVFEDCSNHDVHAKVSR